MRHGLTLFLLCLLFSTHAAAKEIHMAGELLQGIFLRPPGAPDRAFPVPYSAVFVHEPEFATFTFTADFGAWTATQTVVGLGPAGYSSNLLPGILQDDAEALRIEFRVSPPIPSETPPPFPDTTFTLDLNKALGQGQWQWCSACGSHDLPILQAAGTITSFREVPEPATITLALTLVVAAAIRRAIAHLAACQ
jgi:hypothetical protein